MPRLIATVVKNTATDRVTVWVERRCRSPDDESTWVVTVKDSTNRILLRQFSCVHAALALADEALAARVS